MTEVETSASLDPICLPRAHHGHQVLGCATLEWWYLSNKENVRHPVDELTDISSFHLHTYITIKF